MNIRESELPGIGYKFEIITRNNDKIVLVIHNDGRREIYHFDDDHDEVVSSVTFSDTEARQIAGILGGMIYTPKALAKIDFAIGDLILEWYQVEPGAPAVNKTIGDIDIRSNFEVTVIAISKKATKKSETPGPDTVIEAGDTLVISGERDQLNKLIKNLLSNSE